MTCVELSKYKRNIYISFYTSTLCIPFNVYTLRAKKIYTYIHKIYTYMHTYSILLPTYYTQLTVTFMFFVKMSQVILFYKCRRIYRSRNVE